MTTDTQEALTSGRELVLKHKLPLKILKCDSDEEGLHFAYLSPEKTDLRPVSRDLNRHFKVKIYLEELTGEEAARFLPGYGPCGSRLCWTSDSCGNLWPCKFKEAAEVPNEVASASAVESEENPKGDKNPQGVPQYSLRVEIDPKGLPPQSLRVDTEISENQSSIGGHPRTKKKRLVRRLVLK